MAFDPCLYFNHGAFIVLIVLTFYLKAKQREDFSFFILQKKESYR